MMVNRIGKYIYDRLIQPAWSVLCGTKVPVWLLIVGTMATFVGTYLIVPMINKELQKEEIRTQYILELISEIRSNINSVVRDTTHISDTFIQTRAIDDTKKFHIAAQLSELQWRVIDIDIAIGNSVDDDAVLRYQDTILKLQNLLRETSDKNSLLSMLDQLELFLRQSNDILRALYENAGLKTNVDTFKIELPLE